MSMHTKHHRGFSMITAIFMIVLMSSVAVLVMNVSANMTKSTTVQYQREQAMLLAKSYAEYTIMTVMSNARENAANRCIDTIRANNILPNGEVAGGGANAYNVVVNIGYIGPVALIGAVGDNNICTQVNKLGNTTKTELNIVLDIYVTYNDYNDNNPNHLTTYHRRTLQKI